MKKRVAVAMSGGVDSSVAAAILNSEGYEVIALTMLFDIIDSSKEKKVSCGLHNLEDAQKVTKKLGIRHYIIDMRRQLKELVVDNFLSEYMLGRTPNPCVRCNQFLKFGSLLKRALSSDADYLATGHYARITHSAQRRTHNYLLKKGRDKIKDQSYFLYRLRQAQLKHILFPLGDYTKKQVRGLAKKFDLPVADKPGSQEICFLSRNDYRGFIKDNIRKDFRSGPILDAKGNILTYHQGIAFYTIGQREGLGIALGYPVYITKIDASKNTIIVGKKEQAYRRSFVIKNPNFILKPIKKKIVAFLKIRYNHSEAPAKVELSKNRITAHFKKPQFAITPGQSAVFYDHDTVLGGGIIDKVLD